MKNNIKHKAPEPTPEEIAIALVARAEDVFQQSNGAVTVAYYRRLIERGPMGIIAMNLFRASKTSSRAKAYRGKRFRYASYDVKNYSIQQLCQSLGKHLPWGWKRDPYTPGFEWVLYVDLPTGQVSFHSGSRLAGPDYHGDWDGQKCSTERVLKFCNQVTEEMAVAI